jgi:hypothetical protein
MAHPHARAFSQARGVLGERDMVVLGHKFAQARKGRRTQPRANPAAVGLGRSPALHARDPPPVGHGGRAHPETSGDPRLAYPATLAGRKHAFTQVH